MKRGILNRLIATMLSAALIADANAAVLFQPQEAFRCSPASQSLFTEQALSAQSDFFILNYFRKAAASVKASMRSRRGAASSLPFAKGATIASTFLIASANFAGAQGPSDSGVWHSTWLIPTGVVLVAFVAWVAHHLLKRLAVKMFDRGFNISIQSLDGQPIPPEYMSWSLAEVAAVTAATAVVREGFRGKGAVPGISAEEIEDIKEDADGVAFRSIVKVFRDAWAGVWVYNAEGKGRDGVEQSFVGGRFAGVRFLGAWVTRWMHTFGIALLAGFIAIVMSMDVIEGTTATVMNRPGLSGGTSVIVSGPGMKSLGQSPDIYADVIATRLLAHHVEHFQADPLDPDKDVVSNLDRIAHATGRSISHLEVAILGRTRELTRLQAMLPNIPRADIEKAIKDAKTARLGVSLEDPMTHLLVRIIPDGTFLPVVKAAMGESLTPGRHLVVYSSSGSPEAKMDLATVSGYREAGAVVSYKLMSTNIKDTETKEGAYDFKDTEIDGDPGELADPAKGIKARSPAPGLKEVRPLDYQSILNHTKLFTIWDVKGDVDAVITFITDNPLWNVIDKPLPRIQRGVRINRGTATTTLRIRTRHGKARAWFKHRSDRLKGIPKRVAIMGHPGAGKGEHGPTLAQELGVPHFSTGDLLRAARETDEFPEAREAMEKGKLVDDDLMLGMIRKELEKEKYKGGYVIDGLPRTSVQVNMIQQGLVQVDVFVAFDIHPDVYRERARLRYQAAIDAKDEPRKDDKPTAVENRILTHATEVQPSIDEVRQLYPDRFILINTESPLGIAFENPEQSIDYVYEYKVLPALQEWVFNQPSKRGRRRPSSGPYDKNGMPIFDHPSLSKLGLGHPGLLSTVRNPLSIRRQFTWLDPLFRLWDALLPQPNAIRALNTAA